MTGRHAYRRSRVWHACALLASTDLALIAWLLLP